VLPDVLRRGELQGKRIGLFVLCPCAGQGFAVFAELGLVAGADVKGRDAEIGRGEGDRGEWNGIVPLVDPVEIAAWGAVLGFDELEDDSWILGDRQGALPGAQDGLRIGGCGREKARYREKELRHAGLQKVVRCWADFSVSEG